MTLSHTSIKRVAQLLHCKGAGSMELDAQILGIISNLSNPGAESLIGQSFETVQL